MAIGGADYLTDSPTHGLKLNRYFDGYTLNKQGGFPSQVEHVKGDLHEPS